MRIGTITLALLCGWVFVCPALAEQEPAGETRLSDLPEPASKPPAPTVMPPAASPLPSPAAAANVPPALPPATAEAPPTPGVVAPPTAGVVPPPAAGSLASTPANPAGPGILPPADLNGMLPCDSCQRLPLTAAADAMWLRRDYKHVVLGQLSPRAGGQAVDTLASDDVNPDLSVGVRVQLGVRTACDVAWEGTYFGLQSWFAARTITADPVGAGTLATSPWTQTDTLLGGFQGFNKSLGYIDFAQLENAEFNRRRLWVDNERGSLQTLIGFRYTEVDNTLNLQGVDSVPNAFENINIECHNYMLGPQIGAELQRRFGRIEVGVAVKGGLMANLIKQRRSNLNSTAAETGVPPGFVAYDQVLKDTDVGGVFDLAVTASCAVTPRLALRGGYQLLYLAGLQLAPTQLSGFSHGDDMLLHGPTAGFEYQW